MKLFEPQPSPGELPAQLPNPFSAAEPHPLAQRAAQELKALLGRGALGNELALRACHQPGGGQMFGVLVVTTAEGQVGWLSAFSGMLGGRWQVPGFAPPLFDQAARDAVWAAGQAELEAFAVRHAALAEGSAERAGLERARADRSRQLWAALCEGYHLTNARKERRALAPLFSPGLPAGGAGDCAGPKLLGQAYALGLRPLALAEFWWGAPTLGGAQQMGRYYPACRSKCGRVLPFMLEGLTGYGEAPTLESVEVLHDDQWLTVQARPCGCSSAALFTTTRLEPEASGLVVVARDARTHAALKRQLALDQAEHRFVAVLEGQLAGESGDVGLRLRVDPERRPRRMHDPVHGLRTLTRWRVLAREGERTRVELVPRSAIAHQLRVHAAHPQGLGASIVGDQLYGSPGPADRLLLHAASLSFTHPHTLRRLEFQLAPPF